MAETLFGAQRSQAMQARPFLRWAGGKQRWISSNNSFIPKFSGQYIEPFLGGGSVFFYLARTEMRPFEAWLGDQNLQLVKTYLSIRNSPDEVIDALGSMGAAYKAASDKRRFFEAVRNRFNDSLPNVRPEEFIFLNSTCWNGLWRTNAKGRFNVPFGAPKNDDVLPTPVEIRAASAALQSARIRATSWETLLGSASAGDFVFLDPPYFSDHKRGAQAKYGVETFSLGAHERLAETVVSLKRRGVQFVLTNSAEPELVSMYRSKGLVVHQVQVPRAISSKIDERQPVGELIVTNATQEDGSGPPLTNAGVLLDLDALRRRRA